MELKEIINSKIVDIWVWYKSEPYGLDEAEVFLQIDNDLLLDIPYSFTEEIWVKQIDKKVESLFKDLSDTPICHVNKEGKSIMEVIELEKRRSNTWMGKLKNIFSIKTIPKEYLPYKVEFIENRLKNIKNRIIIDFLYFEDSLDKGFLLLDNGYIITETTMANHGTGLAGLNIYDSLEKFEERFGKDYKRL
jgi:hypothetical protein